MVTRRNLHLPQEETGQEVGLAGRQTDTESLEDLAELGHVTTRQGEKNLVSSPKGF